MNYTDFFSSCAPQCYESNFIRYADFFKFVRTSVLLDPRFLGGRISPEDDGGAVIEGGGGWVGEGGGGLGGVGAQAKFYRQLVVEMWKLGLYLLELALCEFAEV